jgi:hypothetical protein
MLESPTMSRFPTNKVVKNLQKLVEDLTQVHVKELAEK